MHLGLEHRRFTRRAQALAVHHAQAAQTLLVRFANEGGQRQTRFVAAQSVQINFFLNRPFAFAKLVRHIAANAGTAKAQHLVGVEQGAGIELVAQGVAQHGLIVLLPLQRYGGHRHGFLNQLFFVRQSLDRTDGHRKQVFVRMRFALGSGQSSGFGDFVGMRLRDVFLNLFQVGKGIEFHPPMLPQSLSPSD